MMKPRSPVSASWSAESVDCARSMTSRLWVTSAAALARATNTVERYGAEDEDDDRWTESEHRAPSGARGARDIGRQTDFRATGVSLCTLELGRMKPGRRRPPRMYETRPAIPVARRCKHAS